MRNRIARRQFLGSAVAAPLAFAQSSAEPQALASLTPQDDAALTSASARP